jgi:hypothetical protein
MPLGIKYIADDIFVLPVVDRLAALPKNLCGEGNADQYNFALTSRANNGLPSDSIFGEFEDLMIVALMAPGAFFTHDNPPYSQIDLNIRDWGWQSDTWD